MKSFLGLTLFVSISLLSTAASAGIADSIGTNKRNSGEGASSLGINYAKPHVHKAARAAAILTYHEGVNPAFGDSAREIRRLDEKNNRGRALR